MNIFKIFSKKKTVSNSNEKNDTCTSLNELVEQYLLWYKKNLEENVENVSYEYHIMKNFIEKIAVWYELAYPENLVDNIIKTMYSDPDYRSKSLFSKNEFINRLNAEEKYLLAKPKYPEIVYVNRDKFLTHFHLSPEGFITEVDEIADLDKTKDVVVPAHSTLIGKHIKQIVSFLKNNNLLLEKNEIETAINNYETSEICLNGMLTSAMFRIMERGGNRIGPYRAFLFALEFGLNIEYPIKYGYDPSDPNLRLFLNEYFKAGGSKDITCYNQYFFKDHFDSPIEEVSLEKVYEETWLNCSQKYTEEESNLQSRLIETISNHANQILKLQKHIKK